MDPICELESRGVLSKLNSLKLPHQLPAGTTLFHQRNISSTITILTANKLVPDSEILRLKLDTEQASENLTSEIFTPRIAHAWLVGSWKQLTWLFTRA